MNVAEKREKKREKSSFSLDDENILQKYKKKSYSSFSRARAGGSFCSSLLFAVAEPPILLVIQTTRNVRERSPSGVFAHDFLVI
jgi:hypothetical protein